MKDFKIVLENEFSRRWNSAPQGGAYECFVCLRRREGQPHRLTFKQDKWNGDIYVEIDGKPYKWYHDWNCIMEDWLLPREITVYDIDFPASYEIKVNEGAPDAFYE